MESLGNIANFDSILAFGNSQYFDVLMRLTCAVIIGGIIGLERSGNNQDAGLRTHILVCLGAAGIMTTSEMLHLEYGGDVGRFGAQVVSGIGFLGAGCILIKGNHIRGLTTAAGLWTTACIGLATGMGYYFISLTMTLLLLGAMLLLQPLSRKLKHKDGKFHYIIKIKLKKREDFAIVSSYVMEHGLHVDSIDMEDDNIFVLAITFHDEYTANQMICSLIEKEEILEVGRE